MTQMPLKLSKFEDIKEATLQYYKKYEIHSDQNNIINTECFFQS